MTIVWIINIVSFFVFILLGCFAVQDLKWEGVYAYSIGILFFGARLMIDYAKTWGKE